LEIYERLPHVAACRLSEEVGRRWGEVWRRPGKYGNGMER